VAAANAAGARTARSAPTATIAAAPYANPVFADSAPDPFVLDDGGTHTDYWQFNTGDLFPILHSPDLIHWTRAGSAFTARPSWVVQTGDWHPWAPSVLQTDEGYVMYYVGVSAAYGVNCIGVATATSPGGPYGDLGPLSGPADADRPIGCGDASAEGAIDPSPFVDRSGAAYLYLSSDWAIAGGVRRLQPTISVIPLAADRLSASGPRGALFSGDPGTWEAAGVSAPTVEGPSMIERGGTYFLLYSGGSYLGAYGMGYATSASPTGPFAKSPSNPILAERTGVLGPGGGDAVVTGPHGGMWMVYHGRSGSYAGPRTLRIDPFSWRPSPAGPDTPLIAGPTSGPQPVAP
jgi:beta-xylosidase